MAQIFNERLVAGVLTVSACAAIIFMLSTPAKAAGPMLEMHRPDAPVQTVGWFQRDGQPPVYPYVYRQGPEGGWDGYFGFVPYEPGNIENQALRRSQSPSIWLRPEANPTPQSR